MRLFCHSLFSDSIFTYHFLQFFANETQLFLQSLKENCNGDYVNIDPENTKCVSDYEAYSEVSTKLYF